jgi:hypothetical protein
VSRFDAVPEELRARPQWVVWRREERGGKLTKVPYRPADTRARAESDGPATWSSFVEAVEALAADPTLDGLGYMFGADDPFAGVDLDDAMEGDELHPDARAVVEALDSYTERSPSGSGVHVLVRGAMPGGRGRNVKGQPWGGGMEGYSSGRYFTVTGEHLHGTPREVRDAGETLAELFPPAVPVGLTDAPARALGAVSMEDRAVLDLLYRSSKVGDKFRTLYEQGFASAGHGYESQSDADLWVLGRLAWATGCDPVQMDRLFRASALMRDKWDRGARSGETYGQGSIARAVSACTAVYEPPAEASPEPAPPELPPGMSGAAVLDTVGEVVSRFIVLPSPEALVAVVLFVAHSHAVEAAYCTPYLHVTSPERRSGKTQLLEVLAELVAHPMHASSMTAAVVYRGLVQDGVRRTLILDEVDTVLGPKPSEAGEALRQVLNAGNRRKGKVMRADRNTGKVEEFDPYGPKVLGGIGDLPETVADRSVRIAMRRALPEELAALDYAGGREIDAACQSVRPLVARWAHDVEEMAANLRPERVEGLNARAMDAWEPLLALAELAGGEWPERAREAAVVLSGEREADADSGGLARRLLYDCHEAFGEAERLSSAELVASLRSMQDSPWRTLDGSGLDASTLSRLLRRYEVRPEKLRVHGETNPVRGYRRSVFVDSWARYVGVTDTLYRPETRNTRNIPANADNPGRNTSRHVPGNVPPGNPHGNGNVPGVPPSPGVETAEQAREPVVTFMLDALRDGTVTVDADMSPLALPAREAWAEALRRYAAGEEVPS